MPKITPAQKKRLAQVDRGELTRSGRRMWFYSMRNGSAITDPMVERLESNGWIDWRENVAVLTEAGEKVLRG